MIHHMIHHDTCTRVLMCACEWARACVYLSYAVDAGIKSGWPVHDARVILRLVGQLINDAPGQNLPAHFPSIGERSFLLRYGKSGHIQMADGRRQKYPSSAHS